MSVKDIRLFGDPILRTPAAPVVDFDRELRQLVKDLGDTMLDAPGAGLAAPQIGVGVGGEFAKEYEVCGVPIKERGARLSEQIVALRKLWSGEPATFHGKYYSFADVPMRPPTRQAGGPPIWCGGRAPA